MNFACVKLYILYSFAMVTYVFILKLFWQKKTKVVGYIGIVGSIFDDNSSIAPFSFLFARWR